MQPMAVDLPGARRVLDFPPRYGQHTQAVLVEAGFSAAEYAELGKQGVVAG
jgi:crotonobetainyl-CoA:carnitine CoA-transferase CaiB-like acyl-CoA transferase